MSMNEQTINYDTETGRNKEQVKAIEYQKPPKRNNQEPPQYGHQFCYGEKLPMAWGVPQQK